MNILALREAIEVFTNVFNMHQHRIRQIHDEVADTTEEATTWMSGIDDTPFKVV